MLQPSLSSPLRSREDLTVNYGNSDIELSDEEQNAVFEPEAEEDESESSEDETQAGQADVEESDQAEQSSWRPLWSKNSKYTLSL